jgi:hypothetical protein
MLRLLVFFDMVDVEAKMFANAKRNESNVRRSPARRLGSSKRPASSPSWTLPLASSASKFQRSEKTGISDYLVGRRCGKCFLCETRTLESLIADLVSVFRSVSFNLFKSEEFGCYRLSTATVKDKFGKVGCY